MLGIATLGPWKLETAAGVTFFTDNDQFLGTCYTGGRMTLNSKLGDDRQNNTRWGATLAYSLDRVNSIKCYYSSGASARTGTDFQVIGLAWQDRWGAGL